MTLVADIYDTIAKEDYLSLYENKKLQFNRIKEFLEFKNDDIAKATGVPLESVRFDEGRIPREVQARMKEWANVLNLVAEHFNGDFQKTALWFTTPNPLLGGNITPRDMIRLGRYKKLFKFIFNSLSENKR